MIATVLQRSWRPFSVVTEEIGGKIHVAVLEDRRLKAREIKLSQF